MGDPNRGGGGRPPDSGDGQEPPELPDNFQEKVDIFVSYAKTQMATPANSAENSAAYVHAQLHDIDQMAAGEDPFDKRAYYLGWTNEHFRRLAEEIRTQLEMSTEIH